MTRQITYSSRYFPPLPVLHIHLRVPDTARIHGPVQAIIDTGADMTIVPLPWLEGIAAPELDEVRLRSHWGEYTSATTYMVDIQVGKTILPALEVVGDPYSTEALIGRNVLNMLLLLLDGPQQFVDVLSQRPHKLKHL